MEKEQSKIPPGALIEVLRGRHAGIRMYANCGYKALDGSTFYILDELPYHFDWDHGKSVPGEDLAIIRYPLEAADRYQIGNFTSWWPHRYISRMRYDSGRVIELDDLEQANKMLELLRAQNPDKNLRLIPLVNGMPVEEEMD